MPNESLPPLPTQEAWQPAGQDWAEFGAWQEERERRFMEEYPPSPEMYGYAEPAVQTVAAAAPEKEQADTSEMRREPVVQGVRPEISEPAVMEPAARRTAAHAPASAQEPQSVQEAERCAGSTVRPADDGREEAAAEPEFEEAHQEFSHRQWDAAYGSAGTIGRTTHAGWVRRIAVQCFRYADRTGAGAERTAGTGAYALRPVRVLSRRTQSGEPSQEARPET